MERQPSIGATAALTVPLVAAALTVTLVAAPAIANPSALPFIPPVDGVISRHFDPPQTRYGAGHRGIDYAVAPGTRVRAAGPGVVSFAGPVAGHHAVTVDHGSGLESTYSVLSEVEVRKGDSVDEGRFIGSTLGAHPNGAGGLHFGVKVDGAYVDPVAYLGPVDVAGAIHLAPLLANSPLEDSSPTSDGSSAVGASGPHGACVAPIVPGAEPPPPNDNVAVAVAGVGSRTLGGTNASVFKEASGPWSLGYPEDRIYRFSYRGSAGPRLHEPYEATDTYRDISSSAVRLRRLLVRIHRRHPESSVDLFAHSQGGLVARAALEVTARAYDPNLPRVEHLVTYGSPHSGAPLAGTVDPLRRTILGPSLLGVISRRSARGSIPDPLAPSVAQMAPGSRFLSDLSSRDVTFGTRVLALAMPHDAIVPAHRALYPGKQSRILTPVGLNGHDSVTSSPEARALAYSFLRDRAEACRDGWDVAGVALGRAVERVESGLAGAWNLVETVALRVPARVASWWATGGALRLADDALRAGISTGRRVLPAAGRLAAERAADLLLPGGGRVMSWLMRMGSGG